MTKVTTDLRMQEMQEVLQKKRQRVRGCVRISAAPGNEQRLMFLGSDEYCPHCDNHFVLEAKTPAPSLEVEGEDVRVDARMLKDERMRPDQKRSIFDVGESADRLG